MSPHRWWLPWILGVASTIAVGCLVAAGVIFTGAFDTTASTPHVRLIAQLTHTTMVHSVHARAKAVQAPARFTPRQVQLGFVDYERRCVSCHGGPATSRAPFAGAMTPTPPYLLDAARRWSPAELYWIVHNGVKMTAMPSWGEVESEDRIWNLVAFLEALPTLSPADYLRMRAQVRGQAAASPRLPESSPRPSPPSAPSRPAAPAPAASARS